MAKPTYEERTGMIGKRYLSDANQPEEMAVTVLDVRSCAGGFTIMYQHVGKRPYYMALIGFKRRYPHELKELNNG
ncbi:hypothetical protein AB4K08_00935 [Serratia fonticola]|uniref:hypothetical protein n=1 Tax=Serratia fonticola TaxID=47917 RepID=UPI0034C6D342